MLPQAILSIVAVAIVVAIAAYGFSTRGYLVHLALVLAPLVVFLVGRPDLWLALVIGIVHSQLIIPGLPTGLHVAHILMAGLLATLIARGSIRKELARKRTWSDLFLLMFLGVLAMTAYVRGFGFRAFGAESWGGMSYLKLFITGGLLLAAKSISLSEHLLRRALYMMLAFSLLPAVAQVVFLLSGGQIYHQYLFIEPYIGGLIQSLEALDTGGAARFHALGGVSASLLMITFILVDRSTPASKLLFGLLIAASAIMAGLSGFRARLLYVVAMLFTVGMIEGDRIRWGRFWFGIAILIISIAGLYVAAPNLPSSIQRAISWLPNINIPFVIKLEANLSTTTRLLVWELAWNEVPQYLLIGKGFTINPNELFSPSVRSDWVLSSFVGHNYHSGPLSLLLDTGLFGFLFGSLFMVLTCVEMFRSRRLLIGGGVARRAYLFLLANHIFGVLSYYLIFGDVRESFPAMFVNLMMMHAILNSNRSPSSGPPQSVETGNFRRVIIS
ncbi:MAG: O-antigen ligase family protein [Kiritimatiellae bacterium]|nr:O-antigen ligase family protein [Kiritimatiellia bacterium]MDW8459007.1 hypothetical protein [Verrucomicrobiota bacterium]